MNDLPPSQQPPTSDDTPARDTGVSRMHLSSVGLAQVKYLAYLRGVKYLAYLGGVKYLAHLRGVKYLAYVRGVKYLVYLRRVRYLAYFKGYIAFGLLQMGKVFGQPRRGIVFSLLQMGKAFGLPLRSTGNISWLSINAWYCYAMYHNYAPQQILILVRWYILPAHFRK